MANHRVFQGAALALILVLAMAAAVWQPEVKAVPVNLTFVGQTGYDELIDEFQRLNPDIKVTYIPVSGGYLEILSKVTIMAASGVPVDVFWIHSYSFGDYLEANLLYPLNELITKDKQFDINAYLQPTVREFTRNNNIYALPRETSSTVVYYNVDMFDQVGLKYPARDWTFDDLLQILKKLTTEQPKPRWGMHLPYRHATMLPFIWGFGADIVSADRTKATYDSKETVAALQWLLDLKYRYKVASIDQDIWSYGNFQNAFAAGAIGMFVDAPYMTARLSQNMKWDVAHIPAGPAGRFTRIAGSAHSISKTTKHLEQAWRLLRFLSGEPGQKALSAAFGVMPALRQLATDWILSDPKPNPANKLVFVEAFAYGRPEPITSNWGKFIEREWAYLGPVFKAEKSLGEVVSELTRELTGIIHQ
ncbi:MAG: ABC transporter substrate-binding protein [Bacteroidota bacterium]